MGRVLWRHRRKILFHCVFETPWGADVTKTILFYGSEVLLPQQEIITVKKLSLIFFFTLLFSILASNTLRNTNTSLLKDYHKVLFSTYLFLLYSTATFYSCSFLIYGRKHFNITTIRLIYYLLNRLRIVS